MSMWHIQEIGAVNQNQRPNEERVISREVGSISIQKVKSRGIRRPRANKKNVTDNIGTISTDGSSDAQDANKKKPRKHEQGIQPRLYNPLSGDVPAREFAEKLNENLKNINSDALICKILSDDINWDDTIETKYGQFPKTSTVAIQQKINVHSNPAELDMIIPHEPPLQPPPVSLPPQPPQSQPAPPPPNSCSHNNMMAMNQPQNNFAQNIVPPIPNQSEQDFYHNLHIRPSMQDHGYDYGRPIRNENDQIIVWNNYKNN